MFTSIIPQQYSGTTGVDVIITWTSKGTTGDVDWDVAFERISTSQDIDSDSFGATTSGDNNSVDAVSGQPEITTISVTDGTNMDSATAGDLFRLKITRDAASDTSTDDVEILSIEIRET